jgi:hypothetical protein
LGGNLKKYEYKALPMHTGQKFGSLHDFLMKRGFRENFRNESTPF